MRFSLVLSIISLWFYTFDAPNGTIGTPTPQDPIRTEAFNVLVIKCNVCHSKKKKQDIFTLENIDALAADIYKQVFIKKKMPKGRKVKLTEQESAALQTWLELVLDPQKEM